MSTGLKLVSCAAATLFLGWGATRSLVRGAPLTATWEGGWFVAAVLALMVVGVGTTCFCLLRKPSSPDDAG